ncbi:uncharacterized protein BO88DRAFT_271168 [Aspergillus vadensis CBS 113365]|uniref:Uncharacterized protein n=1 Tax=Aspergillus vadensis (strain CBS 113365 / IMI 142717 / IBT 24658) TaxID=1448311 RepID=A0A319BAH3_ASPVC|nr:hypothetical protein BO88DRAFT_271168 [Aspergillus vadensis CBS 113365]PYH69956.1 hypothetical protein BO88DRAFT_271168 [Aspergillus vadensis CBS 113365]
MVHNSHLISNQGNHGAKKMKIRGREMYWVIFFVLFLLALPCDSCQDGSSRLLIGIIHFVHPFSFFLSFLSPWGNCLTWGEEVSHYYFSRYSVGRWCMHVVVYQLRAGDG